MIPGKKIMSETETRAKILEAARYYKCEGDVIEIFAKYDKLLYNCTNPEEKKAIGILGNIELHRLLSPSDPGEILVDGQIIK